MNAKHLMSLVLMSAAFCNPASAGSGDAALDASVGQYRGADSRGQWHNPWMAEATGSTVAHGSSADQTLMQIVGNHTREVLDRGGWVNPIASNAAYAGGNALLAARLGDGVTTALVREVPVSADRRLGEIVASYRRDVLDRGGWENTFMTNARYAGGNPLLAVVVGEGVTTGETTQASEAPRVIALSAF